MGKYIMKRQGRRGKRQYKVEGKDNNKPLILAIYTSLMCINTVYSSGELVFIDSSSSFDDPYLHHCLLEGYL